MSSLMHENVLRVHHWTDTLFSFVTTRDAGFRFANGQFTMLGLQVEGKPLLRAYSMVSANYEDHLEFLSIKVPGGPLTSRLQHLQPGDPVLISRKATGTLITGNLLPGRRLYMLSTGTGIAPFLSLVKDPEIYEGYENIVLTHTCRRAEELAYHDLFTHELPRNEFLGEQVQKKLVYYPSVTREPFKTNGRITDLIRSGRLSQDTGMPPLNKETDRLMLCGSPAMLSELHGILGELGFEEGHAGEPGHYITEKAFAEK